MTEVNWGHALSTLLGAMIGFAGSIWTSNAQLKNLLEVEQKKHKNAKEEQTFRVYNQIIYAAGEFSSSFYDAHFPYEQFNFAGYKKVIRPHLFHDFHLLNDEIKDLVMKLDKSFGAYRFENEMGGYLGQTGHTDAIRVYNDLIIKIEKVVWNSGE